MQYCTMISSRQYAVSVVTSVDNVHECRVYSICPSRAIALDPPCRFFFQCARANNDLIKHRATSKCSTACNTLGKTRRQIAQSHGTKLTFQHAPNLEPRPWVDFPIEETHFFQFSPTSTNFLLQHTNFILFEGFMSENEPFLPQPCKTVRFMIVDFLTFGCLFRIISEHYVVVRYAFCPANLF